MNVVTRKQRISERLNIKKQKKDASLKVKKEKIITPIDAHTKRLTEVTKREHCLGHLLISGIHNEQHLEHPDYTTELLTSFCHILINHSRDKAIDTATEFLTHSQNNGWMTYSLTSGNEICSGIPREVQKCLQEPSLPLQWDQLFGLTYALKEYDYWIIDNECGEVGGLLEKAIQVLGEAWRNLLKEDNTTLGIDVEYTRPGIEMLLGMLEKKLSECKGTEECVFQWKNKVCSI